MPLVRAHAAKTLVLCAALGVAGRARAQLPPAEPAPELPPLLTLQKALEIFRQRGFDLLVAEANVRAAQGDLVIAGAVPNPGLSLEAGKNFQCAPSQDCSVVSYSVGLSDNDAISNFITGKRGLRKDVAAAALDAARRSRDDAQRMLEFQVKQSYVQALFAQAQVQNARETRESNLRTRELNERRFALGAINEGDLAKTQVAELEAEQALDQAEQGLRSAKVAVAFLLGFRTLVPDFQIDGEEVDFAVPGPVAQATRETLLKDALEHRPDLRAQVQQERRAEAALSLARRNRIPDFGLSVTYTANGSGDTNISPPNASVGLSFALPVFYQQRGDIAKAEADLSAQQVLRHKAEALVVSDLETAYAQLVSARRLVERMQSTLLERARKARDIAEVQYEKGAASLLDLLDAQRTYTATRKDYAQDLAAYWTAIAQLEQAVAMELRR
jgi:cobalt-zinc-cadmium efflux system outer membrane protein